MNTFAAFSGAPPTVPTGILLILVGALILILSFLRKPKSFASYQARKAGGTIIILGALIAVYAAYFAP